MTRRQLNIIRILGERNSDTTPVDIDQLLERVGYEVKKAAIQFSIRFLCNHGLVRKLDIERRRGANRRLLELTELGVEVYNERILKSTPYSEFNLDKFDPTVGSQVVLEGFEDYGLTL